MHNGSTTFTGIIRGQTIELDRPAGLPDGQAVTVTVQPQDRPALAPGEGLRRSIGGWADDPEGLEQYLEWNRQQRKQSRREIE